MNRSTVRLFILTGVLLAVLGALPLVAFAQDVPELTETYTAPDGTFSFQYPEGWITNQEVAGNAIALFNDSSLLENEGDTMPEGLLLMVFVSPAVAAEMDIEAGVTPQDVLTTLGNGVTVSNEEDTEIEIGDRTALSATGEAEIGDVLLLAIPFGESDTAYVMAVAATGTMKDFEPEILAIVETFQPEIVCMISSGRAVNMRSGPGTNNDQQGTLSPNQPVRADAQETGADGFVWWRLADSGAWVRSDVVEEDGDCDLLPGPDAGKETTTTTTTRDLNTAKNGDNILFSDDFEDGSTLLWFAEFGDPQIVSNDGSHVLRFSGGEAASLLIGDDWTDYEVSMRLKFTQNADIAAIMGIRYSDEGAYAAYMSTTAGRVGLAYLLLPGTFNLLSDARAGLIAGQWYDVKVRAEGTRIELYLGGSLSSWISSRQLSQGTIFFIAPGGAQFYIDDIVVTDLSK
ncbi:MAG: hypothetical protein H6672_21590 [Anaerolineaceae bacterium]|nr:hypothetical protein [Anaerolineaceae bacterium]